MAQIPLPESWKEPFERLVEWLTPPIDHENQQWVEKVARAHIQAPRASGKSTFIPPNVWRRMVEKWPEAAVVFVSSDDEANRTSDLWGSLATPNAKYPLSAVDYNRFFNMIEGVCSTLNDAEEVDCRVVDSMIFIIDISPPFSLDFSIAMMHFYHCIKPVLAGTALRRLRIVTMSSEAEHDHLHDMGMYNCLEMKETRVFEFPQSHASEMADEPLELLLEDIVEVLHAVDENEVEVIAVAIEQDGHLRHAVVCFSAWDRLCNMKIPDTQVRSIRIKMSDPASKLTRFLNTAVPDDAKSVKVFYLEDAAMPGISLQGFKAWLVPCWSKDQYYFHQLGQHVHTESTPSIAEQLDILSWARRADTATVVVGESERDLEYGQDPPSRDQLEERQLDIENKHIDAFVYWVVALHEEGKVDFDHVAKTLVRHPDRFREVHRRLVCQEVLNHNTTTVRLTGTTRTIFEQGLDVLDNDVPLALLLSHDMGNARVNALRVRLVAAMHFGIDMMEYDGFDEINVNMLGGCCRGHTAGLAPFGTWFLLLGLWYLVEVVIPIEHPEVEYGLTIAGKPMTIKTDARRPMRGIIRTLDEILRSHGIPVAPMLQEEGRLDGDEVILLQQSLTRCFAFHQVRVDMVDRGLLFISVTAQRVIRVVDSVVVMATNAMKYSGLDSVNGITRHMVVKGSTDSEVFEARDWTWLPAEFLLEWCLEEHGSCAFLESLRGGLARST